MNITKIEVILLDIPFVKPFKIAHGVSPTGRIIVKVHTDENILGIGEARPNPAFGGETAEGVALSIKYLEPSLIGENPFAIERIVEKMDSILPEHHFAKWALDTAFHDIKAKALKVPLYELLGGCYRKKLPLGYSVGMDDTKQMVADAVGAVKKGFKAVKVKIGTDLEVDMRNLEAIRNAIGPDVPLRVDANAGYTPDKAIGVLRKMERYDLQMIEQPVPPWDLKGMSRIARALDTPIMADESVSTPQDVIRIYEAEAADIVNIKLGKLGGICRGKEAAAIAKTVDIQCFGSGMNEIGVGTAASAHFMASTSNVNYELESASGIFFAKEDILVESLSVRSGFLEVPEKNGLGVELDQAKIKKYSKKEW